MFVWRLTWSGLLVSGLGYQVRAFGLGSRVSGLWFRVEGFRGLGFRVWGFGLGGFGSWV